MPDDNLTERMAEFATNILRLRESGSWPMPDMDRAVVVLAEMVINLTGLLKVEREGNAAAREFAAQMVFSLHPTDPNKPPS